MTAPTPPTANTIAQAPAPPRSCFAIVGPSTAHEPAKTAFASPIKITDAQSQVRSQNSVQPSRRSSRNVVAVSRTSGPTRISASNPAHTRKLTASTARAIPGVAATMITPAIDGPITRSAFRAIPSSAFASWSRAALTVCGISPVSAGMTRPPPIP